MADRLEKSLLLNHYVPYLMANLAKRISDSCGRIYEQEFDLTIPEWRVLARLAESARYNSRELGQITFMDKSKVSRAVKLLDNKGLLVKERDEADHRITYLSLNERGKALYHQIAPEALAWEADLLEALDTTEYRDLIRIMKKLDQRLDCFDQR